MTLQHVKDEVELCWKWGRFHEVLMTTEDPTGDPRDTAYQLLWDALPVARLNEGLVTFRFHTERLNAHGRTFFEGISDAYKYERGVKKETAGDEEDEKSHMPHIGGLFEFWDSSSSESIRNGNRHL